MNISSNPYVVQNPQVPQMPEPDNPLKGVLKLIVIIGIVFAGYQIYAHFDEVSKFLEEIDDDSWSDEYDSEDDAIEDWISSITETDPIDVALKQFLKDNYGALCNYGDDIPDITAPEGYHLTTFTCMSAPSGIYAYGKLDENGLISDVHTNYLYNFYKNDVRLTVASDVSLYYRNPEVVVSENADWVASHPAEIDPATGYAKKTEKADITYIVDVYLPSTNNNVPKSVLLRIGRAIAMSLQNYHINFYYLEDGADQDPANRVAGVDYKVIGEIDCIEGEVLVK